MILMCLATFVLLMGTLLTILNYFSVQGGSIYDKADHNVR